MIDETIKSQALTSLERDKSGLLSYLSALIASGGEILISDKTVSLEFVTGMGESALDFAAIVKENYNYSAEISVVQPEDKRSAKYFKIFFPGKVARRLLEDTKILVIDDGGAVRSVYFGVTPIAKRDRKHFANYIRGLFLTSGKVVKYEDNYIVELLLPNPEFAEEVAELLVKYDISGARQRRGEKTALVFKAGESVANFLTLVGAADSSLEIINKIMLNEINNNINRQANCEASNSDKTCLAAVRQIIAIRKIRALRREDKLSEELLEAARLREANPDMPLAKIAERLRLSKSGVTHRFNRIIAIAEELPELPKEEKQ